jgi:hypothetical protein
MRHLVQLQFQLKPKPVFIKMVVMGEDATFNECVHIERLNPQAYGRLCAYGVARITNLSNVHLVYKFIHSNSWIPPVDELNAFMISEITLMRDSS